MNIVPSSPDTTLAAADRRLLRSWRDCGTQVPAYPDWDAVLNVIEMLRKLPPLVLPAEVARLRGRLALAAKGEAVVIMAGDCAENIQDLELGGIRGLASYLDRASTRLANTTGKDAFWIARKAGQLAKPRSNPTETVGATTLESYRGDLINARGFSAEDRVPNPTRMVHAYGYAAAVHTALKSEPLSPSDKTVPIAHETLLLPYDLGLTRTVQDGTRVCGSAHMLWVGHRTRQANGPHVRFCAGISNPVGIKIGPNCDPDTLASLIDAFEDGREPGRLVLIARMGVERISDALPPLLERSKALLPHPLWLCDPMHGNAEKLPGGTVTRRLSKIVAETETYRRLMRKADLPCGGLHLELAGENVTECLDGVKLCDEASLAPRYTSLMDPRLTPRQCDAVLTAFLA